ncbi:hypothetical protein K9857_03220 [Pseudomonas sp. REP124]|uniref:hypothetical protein n=1 Tax=Pseudomonas sp. REP124 TaxID=2875731 RepID=UPI001CCA3397|nr:hypothetical protein [Pseudomonas sp. REP124]MBZ9780559.1 hypothetical protein [Pseudomonas sp. REP124]
MKVLNGIPTAAGRNTERPLILTQRTALPGGDKSILFQETCLGLASDQSQIVMRRYFERYSPEGSHWVEYIHSIPTTEFIHWIMTHGQLRIECSEDAPHAQFHVHA